MTAPDELLPIVDRVLAQVEQGCSLSQSWSQTEEGQKVIQFVIQVGKYNTNLGKGEDFSIGDGLDKKLLEEVRDLLRSQLPPPLPNIDWQQVSRSRLNEQIQRLTTNPLTHVEGITYRTEQVYVPLGLVERKRQARRREDVSPEQGSLLYEETEITQKFEHEAFLEQVLRQEQSPRSSGRRIAVIGEPGAGKTTLLQQIARWVSENIDGAIAIWVSLADLQGQELEDYLLERWLPAVVQQVGQAEASTQVKDAFVAQVQQGRVWLLLDGVDEMQVSSGNPLSEIERQVRLGGLLSPARIVLTCRLNLWDGNRHALDTFDTYRTLEFSYPIQVEQFVGLWFEALPDAQAGQAERLCAALKQPGKERIRDLVKNPLRLTLLCFNWYLGEGTLPETKAGLYEQFVADFYEWKRERFPTTVEQRRRLNAALGELAREAIDKEATRFRLRYDFVCKFLGDPDEPDSSFQMALRLGWLNQIGVDAENRKKAVYAFFHPTFQEYCAALGIEDWHYLLNHIPPDPSSKEANYRIFLSHWKEVFLLWIGRKEISKQSKEEFIEALTTFEDVSQNFYSYRAYFLSLVGISEFQDCRLLEKIIIQVIEWSLGFFDNEEKNWKTFINIIEEESKSSLKELRLTRIADIMLDFISGIPEREQETLVSAIKLLGETGIVLSDDNTISKFNKLLRDKSWTYDEYICDIAEAVGKINPGNQEAKKVLTDLIISSQNPYSLEYAAVRLERIDPDNQDAINCFIRLLYLCDEEDALLGSVVRTLGEIGVKSTSSDHSRMLITHELIFIFLATSDTYIREGILESLKRICDHSRSITDIILDGLNILKDALNSLESDKFIEWFALELISEIGLQEPSIIEKLTNLILSIEIGSEIHDIRIAAISLLGRVGSRIGGVGKLLVEDFLVSLLDGQEEEELLIAAIALGNIDSESNESVTALLKLLRKSQNKNFLIRNILFLRVIGKNNRKVIDGLVEVLKRSNSDEVLRFAIGSLGDIAHDDLSAIQILNKFLENHRKRLRLVAAENLFKITLDNSKYINMLLEALAIQDLEAETYYDESGKLNFEPTYLELSMRIEESILRRYNSKENHAAKVIQKISKYINHEMYEHDFSRYEACYWLMWHCSKTMNYNGFYKAWCG